MRAITLLIAEACVNSVIESLVQSISASTLSKENAQEGSGRLTAMGIEWTVTYKPFPSGPKLEDGVKPPLGLTKEFVALEPRLPGRLRCGKTWWRRWRCMWGSCWGQGQDSIK